MIALFFTISFAFPRVSFIQITQFNTFRNTNEGLIRSREPVESFQKQLWLGGLRTIHPR